MNELKSELKRLFDDCERFLNSPTTTNSDLCLTERGRRPTSLTFKYPLDSKHLLMLVYLPASSVQSNQLLNNRTMNQVIKPVLGESIYVLELLPFGYANNADVDLRLVSATCKKPNSFIVKNYIDRIRVVLKIRKLLQVDTVGWIGGPDVQNALTNLISEFNSKFNGCFFSSQELGRLVISPYHPSAHLMARGDINILRLIQCSLIYVNVLLDFINQGQELTEENINRGLEETQREHIKRYQYNVRMLNSFIGPKLDMVLKSKRSIYHRNCEPLFELLNFVNGLVLSLADEQKQELFANIASTRLWCRASVQVAISNIQEMGLEKYMFFLKGNGGGSSAQKTIIETANALEKNGFSHTLLKGNGGGSSAQKTIIASANSLKNHFTNTEIESLLRGNNATHKGQVVILKESQRLLDNGFEPELISQMLAGSRDSGSKIISAITEVVLQLHADGKCHTYIANYVRRGRNDTNRKYVAAKFLGIKKPKPQTKAAPKRKIDVQDNNNNRKNPRL